MADRYHSLTVVLDHDITDADARSLIKAISHMRNVIKVSGNVSDSTAFMARARARDEVLNKLYKLIDSFQKGDA